VLISNAGTPATREPIDFADLDAMTEEFWQAILQTNLLGVFRCAHAAAPALRATKGAIVNTASVAGLGRRGSSLAYSASKAGVINVTRGLARALAPDVRVNAVAPGLVQTPWTNPWSDERKQGTIDPDHAAPSGNAPRHRRDHALPCRGRGLHHGETIVVDGGAA
jgi:3-oxoacyl-[acyl-carrier protein] reductase